MTKKDRQYILTEAKRKILNLIEEMENSPPLTDEPTKDNLHLKAKAASTINHLHLAVFEIEQFERELDLV